MLQYSPQDQLTDARRSRFLRLKLAYEFLGPLFAAADAFIILTTTVLGSVAYQYFISDGPGDVSVFLGIGLLSGLAYASLGWQFGIYRVSSLLQPRRDYGQIFSAWMIVVLLMALLLFLFKMGALFSRGSIILSAVATLVALVAWRNMIKRYIRSAFASGAIEGRRTLLVGTRNELANFDEDKLLFSFGLHEVGRAELPNHRSSRHTASQLELAAFKDAIDRSRVTFAQEIVVALPWGNAAQLSVVRELLRTSPLPAKLLPDQFIRSIWDGEAAYDEHHRLIRLQRAPLTQPEQLIKRIFDVVTAAALLLVLSPLLLLVGIAIKLDSAGPIVFRQRRNGFNGREFVIYKFRTMAVTEAGGKVIQAKRNDPRVTGIGRLLRRSSIDELLQLFNVLKGDMSLVGPRPHAICHDDKYGAIVAKYAFRHHVKPGITGWAQVNGFRGETRHLAQMKKRIELDLWYINHWSPLLDVQVLLRTLVEQIRSQKAY